MPLGPPKPDPVPDLKKSFNNRSLEEGGPIDIVALIFLLLDQLRKALIQLFLICSLSHLLTLIR